jgi:hypothetical protein
VRTIGLEYKIVQRYLTLLSSPNLYHSNYLMPTARRPIKHPPCNPTSLIGHSPTIGSRAPFLLKSELGGIKANRSEFPGIKVKVAVFGKFNLFSQIAREVGFGLRERGMAKSFPIKGIFFFELNASVEARSLSGMVPSAFHAPLGCRSYYKAVKVTSMLQLTVGSVAGLVSALFFIGK